MYDCQQTQPTLFKNAQDINIENIMARLDSLTAEKEYKSASATDLEDITIEEKKTKRPFMVSRNPF